MVNIMILALIGLAAVLKARFKDLNLIGMLFLLFLPDIILTVLLFIVPDPYYGTDIMYYIYLMRYFFTNFDASTILTIGNLAVSEEMAYSHNLLIIGIVCLVILGVIVALRGKKIQYIYAALPLIHLGATLLSIYHTLYICYPLFPTWSNIRLVYFYIEQLTLKMYFLTYFPWQIILFT